ncbi:MAG: VWA domain-containing protein [Terriglobales bacterium]
MKIRAALLAGLFCVSAAAQSPVPSSEGGLRLGVVVIDGNGVPIRDLTNKDFVVESHGKAQAWQLESVAPASASTELSPGDFTNRNPVTKGPGLIVIVLDTLHTRWVDEKYLRPEIVKYLRLCARRDEPVSLLLMDPHGVLQSVHDYSAGSATLTAALNRAEGVAQEHPAGGADSPEVIAEAARITEFLKGTTANNTSPSEFLRASPEPVLRMFHAVAQSTAGIPGRKSLVWIANITPFEVEDKTGMVISLSRQGSGGDTSSLQAGIQQSLGVGLVEHGDLMSESEIKQLRPLWKSAMAALLQADVAVIPVGTRRSAAASFDPQTLHAMKAIADLTGGEELHGPDPFELLAGLSQQNVAAYDLAGTASAVDCKSDWCGLKISVNRPGARVIAPGGLFPNVVAPTDKDRLTEGMTSPFDFTEVPMIVRWTTMEASGAKKKMGFVVTFPPEAEMPPADKNELNLEIFVRATSPQGGNVQNANFNAAGQLPPEAAQQARLKGFALNNVIELAPGDYMVKFLVHDKITGRLGTITVPLKVA